MQIAVVGTGYVGLVTGAGLAEMGNSVTCIDIDPDKITALDNGRIPIYEPGLEQLVGQNIAAGLLSFTTDMAVGINGADFIFIAVGTPPGENGSADLRYVLAVARDIGRHLKGPAIVIDKSTVPVGTAEKVRRGIQQELDQRGEKIPFDVASNPEFLKEGTALEDFMKPDRIVIGTDNDNTRSAMHQLYAPFVRNHDRILTMGLRDAEMCKYAANAMLATKISFMNEMAGLCDALGVDVENVRLGIGSDARIGYSFIYPGCGYGGSCLPKDVQAVMHMAKEQGVEAGIMQAVEARNESQKTLLFERVHAYFGGDLEGKPVAVWGLAFKPGTDDMRAAPSVPLVNALLESGARVQVFDPVAMDVARSVFGSHWQEQGRLFFCEDQYQALRQAQALLLVTEWKRFRQPDFDRMKETMTRPLVFDGRNQYEPAALRSLGFEYYGIGRAASKIKKWKD